MQILFMNVFLSSSVMWRKDDMEISHDAGHVLKASGEEHSLVIKQMSLNDVGSYGVTAVSAAGRAFCSTALNVQPGETRQSAQWLLML